MTKLQSSTGEFAISTNGAFVFVYEAETREGTKYTGRLLGDFDGRTKMFKKWYPEATKHVGFLITKEL